MTEIQAALGLSQLHKLEEFIKIRTHLAKRYDEMLADLPLQKPISSARSTSSHHLYVVRVSAQKRRTIFEGMRSQGIGVNVHYMPIYQQPYYRAKSVRTDNFPEAEKYYREAISLPLFPDLHLVNQSHICDVLEHLLRH